MVAIYIIVLCLALAVVVALVVVSRLIYICAPNEVLVFSGSHRMVGSRKVGYRLVQGGRGIRIPLFERVDRMDLTNMAIDIKTASAYAKGGIPLNVEGVANLKVASTEPTIGNAIERFLGKDRLEIMRVARETLEGNMRGVLATLTPEEINQDRIKFAAELLTEADKDLKNLGLKLDTLKIQNVSDDREYLNSLGRKQSADLVMRSRIAEAENSATSAENSAENMKTQEMARVEAEISIARANAQRRIVDAQTKKGAMIAEQQAHVTAAVAKATAELDVQRARKEQVRLQLEADQIKPAEAARVERIQSARAKAAKVIEEGKATATALQTLAEVWSQSGESARQILLAQKLSPLVSQLMESVRELPIDKVTVIDKALSAGGNNLAVNAALTSEQLKQTIGVDLPAMLNRFAGSGSSDAGSAS